MLLSAFDSVVHTLFWTTHATSNRFSLQIRRGREFLGQSQFKNLLYATLDSVLDQSIPKFRIIYTSVEGYLHYVIAESDSRTDIDKDWIWINEHVSPKIEPMINEEQLDSDILLALKTLIDENLNVNSNIQSEIGTIYMSLFINEFLSVSKFKNVSFF
ncbi:hypothetical protein GJ496_008728 [Pomphorhynchus laevis]|nr:hypothetical protein GJ496_008728 [Pomphorhynchus laevis]